MGTEDGRMRETKREESTARERDDEIGEHRERDERTSRAHESLKFCFSFLDFDLFLNKKYELIAKIF